MKSVSKAIIKTIIYSEIFGSSPNKLELFVKLHSQKLISKSEFDKSLEKLLVQKRIKTNNNRYNIHSHSNLFKSCKLASIINQKNQLISQNIDLISSTPFIRAVFLTGSLACRHPKPDDDIDLMIVTSKNRLWISRFLLLLKTHKIRRRPNSTVVNNKFCFNIFTEEDNLNFSPENIFIANEIIHSFPVYDSDNIYQNYLKANLWVVKYLANSLTVKKNQSIINNFHPKIKFNRALNKQTKKKSVSVNLIFNLINYLLYLLQFLFMLPKTSNETIKLNLALFHPKKTDSTIISEYKTRLKSHNLI